MYPTLVQQDSARLDMIAQCMSESDIGGPRRLLVPGLGPESSDLTASLCVVPSATAPPSYLSDATRPRAKIPCFIHRRDAPHLGCCGPHAVAGFRRHYFNPDCNAPMVYALIITIRRVRQTAIMCARGEGSKALDQTSLEILLQLDRCLP